MEATFNTEETPVQVNCKIIVATELFEIEGTLIPYNTGRCEEYKFETSWFSDELAEEYFNEHWESISEQVLAKYEEYKLRLIFTVDSNNKDCNNYELLIKAFKEHAENIRICAKFTIDCIDILEAILKDVSSDHWLTLLGITEHTSIPSKGEYIEHNGFYFTKD